MHVKGDKVPVALSTDVAYRYWFAKTGLLPQASPGEKLGTTYPAVIRWCNCTGPLRLLFRPRSFHCLACQQKPNQSGDPILLTKLTIWKLRYNLSLFSVAKDGRNPKRLVSRLFYAQVKSFFLHFLEFGQYLYLVHCVENDRLDWSIRLVWSLKLLQMTRYHSVP